MLKIKKMFNPKKIQECLYGLVGFEQTIDQNLPRLDADLTTSESGIYFNQLHPLISMQNLQACAENFGDYAVQEYSGTETYDTGVIVAVGQDIYESLKDGNAGNAPAASPTFWRKTNLISVYLRRTLNASIAKLMYAVYTEKNLHQAAPTLLNNIVLYDGAGNFTDKVQKQGRFVGFKIGVKHRDVSATLSRIGLQLDTVNPELPIYLYNSSQQDPVAVFNLNYSAPSSFQWLSIQDAILSFVNDEVNAGSSYAIGYYEDDLLGQAIRKDQNFSSPCSSCGRNYKLWKSWSKHMRIYPFEVRSGNINLSGRTMWDEKDEVSVNGVNWGMNFMLSAKCDVTDLICRNREIFVNLIGKQVVADLLNMMANSTRSNQIEELTSALAVHALVDRQHYNQGVTAELRAAIRAVDFDLTQLNSVCLPCNNSGFATKFSTAFR